MQKKYNMLTDEEIQNSWIIINTQTQYLSKTIDDFRDFIKTDRIVIN